MSVYKEALKTKDLKDGEMTLRVFGKQQILIAKVEGIYYATDNRCPHLLGDLSKGTLDGTVVTCPRHGSKFDLKNGKVIRWTDWQGLRLKLAKLIKSERPLRTYKVKLEGDSVMVETES